MDQIMDRGVLRREMLHPLLRTWVYGKFAAGFYETAVRDAFLIVEDRVKTASGIKGEAGVRLMRAAFDPNGGANRASADR